MKTLAELKRDAKAGKIVAEMIEWHGATGEDIPERLRGKRQIVDANSAGIFFLNAGGKKSELRIEAASLIEYTDTSLTIFYAGKRDLTPDEKAIKDKWQTMRDKRQEEIDALTDGSTSFYREKNYYRNAGYEYLFGTEMKQGKKYDHSSQKVIDNKVKGDAMLKYKICS
jgi:hypothetical protein